MKTPLIMAVVIGVLVLIVGCTQQATAPEAKAVASQVIADDSEAAPLLSVQSYQVAIEDGSLMPVDVEVHAGDTVEWVNKDTVRYILMFSGSEERLPVGGTFEYAFTEIGTVRYTALEIEGDEDGRQEDRDNNLNDQDEGYNQEDSRENNRERELHGTVIVG